jgi:hypothetical protein
MTEPRITLDQFARNALHLLDNDPARAESFMVSRLVSANDNFDLLRDIVLAALREASKPAH